MKSLFTFLLSLFPVVAFSAEPSMLRNDMTTNWSNVNVTKTFPLTNRITLAAAGTGGANGTYTWNGADSFTNAFGGVYLDGGGVTWFLTNTTADFLYQSIDPIGGNQAYPFCFPILWEQLDGSLPIPSGSWTSSTNLTLPRLQRTLDSTNYPPMFTNGLEASFINVGPGNYVTNQSQVGGSILGSSIVGGSDNQVWYDQSVIAGGNGNKIFQRQGFIGGGNQTTLESKSPGSSADSAAIGTEGGRISADASANVGTISSTNLAFRNSLMAATFGSSLGLKDNTDANSFCVTLLSALNSYGVGSHSIFAGNSNTNFGDWLLAFGKGNFTTNNNNGVAIGERLRGTNGAQVMLFGYGATNASGASNLFRVGFTNVSMTFNGSGSLDFPKTVTTAGTTGNQTIHKMSGSVNFAAAAQTITVTCNLVTANSIIMATVATDDTAAKSCIAVPGSSSFVLKLNAAANAETRVSFLITN